MEPTSSILLWLHGNTSSFSLTRTMTASSWLHSNLSSSLLSGGVSIYKNCSKSPKSYPLFVVMSSTVLGVGVEHSSGNAQNSAHIRKKKSNASICIIYFLLKIWNQALLYSVCGLPLVLCFSCVCAPFVCVLLVKRIWIVETSQHFAKCQKVAISNFCTIQGFTHYIGQSTWKVLNLIIKYTFFIFQ